ncbi:peptidase M13 family protein [Mycobacterium kansasii 824]|nr:peptidase M13 family protein [Mycobacterium kansasii 824]
MTVEAIRSGIDLSYVDADARPQDDLFGHVNGRWLKEHQIPADRAIDGAFRQLFDRAEEQVRDLIVEASQACATGAATGGDEQRIGDLYASFIDEDAVERRGLQPLHDELATIDGAADRASLAAVIGALQRTGMGGGIGFYVDTDSKDSTRYLLHFSQSGIGLPDESYYRDERHAAVLAAYPATSRGCSAWCTATPRGPAAHAAVAARIVALESKVAAAHWDVVKRRDAELTYNLRTFADLQVEGAGFDWEGWVTGMGSTPQSLAELVVRQPDYLHAFAALWDSEDLDDWKCWARWRLIRSRAPG